MVSRGKEEGLEERIRNAPSRSGVYIFKRKDKPIYIGKAKDLKKRLQQHLKASSRDPKERAIFKESTDLDWIITRNEFEALVLEIDLIQSYKPKYNILHKYGSGYPVLVITEDRFPTVKVARGIEQEGSVYGPFLQASRAYKVKRLIHRTFKLRTCDPLPTRKEPCMDYHLGLCCAPCCGYVSEEEYRLNVEGAKALLSGNVGEVLEKLYRKIEVFSSNLQFEKCAQIRDQIKALENIAKGQSVSGLPFKEADLFYLHGTRLGLFLIRSFRLVNKEVYTLDRREEVEEFIAGYYYNNYIPETILANFPLPESLRRWIAVRSDKDLRFERRIPQSLLEIAKENVEDGFDRSVLEEIFNSVLGIKLPRIIEGFDVSHFYGEGMVGSCVVWEEGRMNKKRYRRYRVKTVHTIDDYASLREILSRRARRIREGSEPAPDVWLIDGGKGQLKVGVSVKRSFNLPVKVMSLAKEEEILYTEDGKEIRLKEYPELYRVFGLIRDEAHRFALTYSRKLRSRDMMEDILDKVEGVGETRKRIIYRNFDTLYDFIEASDSHLKKLGLPVELKQKVLKYLKGGN